MATMKWVLMIALLAMMCAEGMRVTRADLAEVWRHPSSLARGVASVIVLAPVAAVLTVVMLHPSRPVALGLAFLAAAPLAPFILLRLARSGESFRLAASLHVALAALSIVTAPVVLVVLGRVLGFASFANPLAIAAKVLVTLFIPFASGIAIRRVAPRAAPRLCKVLEAFGSATLLVAIAILVVAGRGFFAEFGVRDYAALTLFCVLALASGHYVAANDDERTTYALESAARNPGIALLMAESSLGPVRGAVLLPYLAVFVLVTTVYSVVRKRTTSLRSSASHASLRPRESVA
jgi:bile acid:Na+ symporter, BASS family